jgi:hypothetical protein
MVYVQPTIIEALVRETIRLIMTGGLFRGVIYVRGEISDIRKCCSLVTHPVILLRTRQHLTVIYPTISESRF